MTSGGIVRKISRGPSLPFPSQKQGARKGVWGPGLAGFYGNSNTGIDGLESLDQRQHPQSPMMIDSRPIHDHENRLYHRLYWLKNARY
jgi:hypothetical protein